MKTLVLGIGNPILGDDGVGVHVAQDLAKKIRDKNVDIKDVNFDGLNLLELIVGYDKLIIIDAIMTEDGKAGEIYRTKPEEVCEPVYSAISTHHFNLASTIEIGKRLFPKEIPKEVTIFAVGTRQVTKVTEEMTEEVEKAVPKIVSLVLEEINSTSVGSL